TPGGQLEGHVPGPGRHHDRGRGPGEGEIQIAGLDPHVHRAGAQAGGGDIAVVRPYHHRTGEVVELDVTGGCGHAYLPGEAGDPHGAAAGVDLYCYLRRDLDGEPDGTVPTEPERSAGAAAFAGH